MNRFTYDYNIKYILLQACKILKTNLYYLTNINSCDIIKMLYIL